LFGYVYSLELLLTEDHNYSIITENELSDLILLLITVSTESAVKKVMHLIEKNNLLYVLYLLIPSPKFEPYIATNYEEDIERGYLLKLTLLIKYSNSQEFAAYIIQIIKEMKNKSNNEQTESNNEQKNNESTKVEVPESVRTLLRSKFHGVTLGHHLAGKLNNIVT
jgi:hypothetical protein